ncbi:lysozyme [Saccharothrix violaceirubra]|uniref:Lysozyme n=1 Tax=Saccharothrix violaceirubra TaxID=413306 RepID=A0A7W7TAH8_9PSEU|nr:lysozyme [Saccharothrix violaceirubra]MBB4969533.1 GH25 family lysozyme M1 (1,4-beta-N-acetylmuramidase) [Saccharothrix violaceirubra]
MSTRTWTALVAALSLTAPLAPAASALPAGSADHYAGSQIRKHEGTSARADGPPAYTPGSVPGMDVSSHQGDVDWQRPWDDGARFAYVKATEGTTYKNPNFHQQYDGAHAVGMIRGAYHFALPDRSGGAEQADFFVDNGGWWNADGRTLPGAADLEYNPYGDTCYGLDQNAMGAWVKAFSDRVAERTSRFPTIYTSTSWWDRCVGTSVSFGATNPLWVAHYTDVLGDLPNGWDYETIWQWQAAGLFPGDQNLFNGTHDQLTRIAAG